MSVVLESSVPTLQPRLAVLADADEAESLPHPSSETTSPNNPTIRRQPQTMAADTSTSQNGTVPFLFVSKAVDRKHARGPQRGGDRRERADEKRNRDGDEKDAWVEHDGEVVDQVNFGIERKLDLSR